jgi:hypothetical protein
MFFFVPLGSSLRRATNNIWDCVLNMDHFECPRNSLAFSPHHLLVFSCGPKIIINILINTFIHIRIYSYLFISVICICTHMYSYYLISVCIHMYVVCSIDINRNQSNQHSLHYSCSWAMETCMSTREI